MAGGPKRTKSGEPATSQHDLRNQEMGGARRPAAGPPATSVVSVGTVRVAKDHAVTAPGYDWGQMWSRALASDEEGDGQWGG